MKYLNDYNKNDIKIDIRNKFFWFIPGDMSNVIEVLNNMSDNDNISHSIKRIIFTVQRKGHIEYGIFIFMHSFDFITYSDIMSLSEKNKIIKRYNIIDWVYQGELKIKNDNLVLDVIDIDIEKYNL